MSHIQSIYIYNILFLQHIKRYVNRLTPQQHRTLSKKITRFPTTGFFCTMVGHVTKNKRST